MTMPAISLWQPWASLLVTRQPATAADLLHPDCTYMAAEYPGHHLFCNKCGWAKSLPPVKRFETRSWPCPPSLIGQRFAIHAAKRTPKFKERFGDLTIDWADDGGWALTNYDDASSAQDRWLNLPLGAVVGSGIVTACLLIVDENDVAPDCDHITPYSDGEMELWTLHDPPLYGEIDWSVTDISDQLPYGDYRPGRFAWLIEGAAPTTERCPWCWGSGLLIVERNQPGEPAVTPCHACDGAGRCEPIPARGAQRIWQWTPEVAA